MASSEVKKRRACDACTKAKAKCSPSQSQREVCQRCERLDKVCAYGESLRKRGPGKRSRMKQLEQRVETLMGMLSATGAAPDLPETNSSTSAGVQSGRSDTTHTDIRHLRSDSPRTSPFCALADAFTPSHSNKPVRLEEPITYDPVHTGLLDETLTIQYLDGFRREYADCFPFIVIDPSMEASALRQEQPFLFLSIMATMAYRTPSTQRALGEVFRQQVATRIVGNSHKGLEMLQGLLVHTAYYHYYYQPGHQQLALMIQMCVAMAQELGLSRRFKSRESDALPKLSNAENRALLGTYYLAAAFAQAWRKRTTVPYTKAIARACQSFSQQPEHASDLFIAPLVQASELICRISEYFSYDDIDDSDIHGENMLKLSTNNFSAELQRLRDAIPESARNNTTICLSCDMLEVIIHECSVHGTLWQTPPPTTYSAMTNVRIGMLQRTLSASQTFARTLLAAPASSLNGLTFPVWSGWFYSTLLVLKIVLLQQTGDMASARLNNVPQTVGDLLPQEHGGSTTRKISIMTASLEYATLSESITSLEEMQLVSLFESFIEKLEVAAPQQMSDNTLASTRPFLMKVAALQAALLAGIKKMTRPEPYFAHTQQTKPGLSTSNSSTRPPSSYPDQHALQPQYPDLGFADHASSLNLCYLDNAAAFEYQPGQQLPLDGWLWDMVMNDGNMFTM